MKKLIDYLVENTVNLMKFKMTPFGFELGYLTCGGVSCNDCVLNTCCVLFTEYSTEGIDEDMDELMRSHPEYFI